MHASVEHLSKLDQGAAWRRATAPAEQLKLLPLHEAVLACDQVRVDDLLRAGADATTPMAYGFSPLHLAARGFSIAAQGYRSSATLRAWGQIIEALLDAGADAAARDWQNRLPMALADGRAPARLRLATEQAAERGAFLGPNDGVGQGKRAGGDCMLRSDGSHRARLLVEEFA